MLNFRNYLLICFTIDGDLIFFFWPHPEACRILVPQPEIELGPLSVKAQSPNHWTAREFPDLYLKGVHEPGKGRDILNRTVLGTGECKHTKTVSVVVPSV